MYASKSFYKIPLHTLRYVYMYMCVYIYVCVCIYTHICISLTIIHVILNYYLLLINLAKHNEQDESSSKIFLKYTLSVTNRNAVLRERRTLTTRPPESIRNVVLNGVKSENAYWVIGSVYSTI